MTRHSASLPEDAPKPPPTVRWRHLTRGAKIVCVGGLLFFFSLFLTWQNVKVEYPGTQSGPDRQGLDAFDVWGVLIAFLTLGLVALVLVVFASDLDVPADVPWELVVLVYAAGLFVLTLLKSLTDADSAWGSYAGLLLAAVVVGGAAYDWYQAMWGPSAALRRGAAGGSAQPLEEQDPVLAGTVVVLRDAVDLEAEGLVERDRDLVRR